MEFASGLHHNAVKIARIAIFRLRSHSMVASQSNGNPAFMMHAVGHCACSQSCDETDSMLLRQQT